MGNIETTRGIYESFSRLDFQAILDIMSDEVDFEDWDDNSAQKAGCPPFARRIGKAQVAEFFEACAGVDFHKLEPYGYLEGPGQVAVLFRIDATVKLTGRRFQDEEIHLWSYDDAGRLTGLRHYIDTAKQTAAYIP